MSHADQLVLAEMTAAELSQPPLLENGTRSAGLRQRLVDIWRYRELLDSLIRRELKVRYKNSVLGFAWTLLNPMLYLVIFSIVFKILGASTPRFGLYMLSGLLVYNLCSVGLTAATTSITGNGPLVQKVWFPREILPLASIGANCVTFCFQLTILLAALLVFRQSPEWSMLWLVIPAIIVTLMITVGLGLFLSALNVYFRDVQHFLELGLLVWFWMTPIVYPFGLQIDNLPFGGLANINPLTPVVTTFQRVVYNPMNFADDTEAFTNSEFIHLTDPDTLWYLRNLGWSFFVGVVFLLIGFKMFDRLEANLGEEL